MPMQLTTQKKYKCLCNQPSNLTAEAPSLLTSLTIIFKKILATSVVVCWIIISIGMI